MDVREERKKIDSIDCEIMLLLRRRMELALGIGRLKETVREPEREEEVIRNVRGRSDALVRPEFTESLYRKVMEESARIQGEGLKLTGFQGEHGAYSEAAAVAYDPKAVPIPCREFPDVFSGVASGRLDFGIVPVENSLEGAVTEVNDLLAGAELKIAGEIAQPIRHCLLAPPGTDHRDLRVVYSHPQALAQCRGYLSRHKLEARPFYDTAGAARMLADENRGAVGVIASASCAVLYHLDVMDEDIGDHESNSTRFIILSKTGASGPGDKCSVVFSITHKAGALASVMQIFADGGINLTRIESRPQRSALGYYRFFLDFEGSSEDGRVVAALGALERKATAYKFLGCYKGMNI